MVHKKSRLTLELSQSSLDPPPPCNLDHLGALFRSTLYIYPRTFYVPNINTVKSFERHLNILRGCEDLARILEQEMKSHTVWFKVSDKIYTRGLRVLLSISLKLLWMVFYGEPKLTKGLIYNLYHG